MIRRRPLRSLGRDERGATIVEFVFVAPIMLMMLMGLMDLSYRFYVQSILTGAVQRAGRNTTLETGGSRAAALDAQVLAEIRQVARNATWNSTRESFADYGSMSPEPFNDTNGNLVRDPGECYSDVNDNSNWDAYPAKAGLGGASDTVAYTFTVRYPRLFPIGNWLGWGNQQEVSARTILKNQPFTTQAQVTPPTRCTP